MNPKIVFDNSYKCKHGCAIDYYKKLAPVSMLSLHYHRDYELYVLIEGSRKYFLSDRICMLGSHSVMFIKPNEPHQAIAAVAGAYERYVLYISPEIINEIITVCPHILDFSEHRAFTLTDIEFNEILNDIKIIEGELNSKQNFAHFSIRNRINDIILILSRINFNTDERFVKSEVWDIKFERVFKYISEHYSEKITLSDCAEMSYMSVYYFSRMFTEATKMTFNGYINKVRVIASCHMLENTDAPITFISHECGFDSTSYFGKVFRAIIGMSPTEYRNRDK